MGRIPGSSEHQYPPWKRGALMSDPRDYRAASPRAGPELSCLHPPLPPLVGRPDSPPSLPSLRPLETPAASQSPRAFLDRRVPGISARSLHACLLLGYFCCGCFGDPSIPTGASQAPESTLTASAPLGLREPRDGPRVLPRPIQTSVCLSSLGPWLSSRLRAETLVCPQNCPLTNIPSLCMLCEPCQEPRS